MLLAPCAPLQRPPSTGPAASATPLPPRRTLHPSSWHGSKRCWLHAPGPACARGRCNTLRTQRQGSASAGRSKANKANKENTSAQQGPPKELQVKRHCEGGANPPGGGRTRRRTCDRSFYDKDFRRKSKAAAVQRGLGLRAPSQGADGAGSPAAAEHRPQGTRTSRCTRPAGYERGAPHTYQHKTQHKTGAQDVDGEQTQWAHGTGDTAQHGRARKRRKGGACEEWNEKRTSKGNESQNQPPARRAGPAAGLCSAVRCGAGAQPGGRRQVPLTPCAARLPAAGRPLARRVMVIKSAVLHKLHITNRQCCTRTKGRSEQPHHRAVLRISVACRAAPLMLGGRPARAKNFCPGGARREGPQASPAAAPGVYKSRRARVYQCARPATPPHA